MASHLSVATHFAHDAEANTCKPFFVKWISISIQLTNRLMGWCCCYLYRIAYSIQKRTKVDALTISFLATQMRYFSTANFPGVEYLRGQTIVRTNGCRASEKVCHRRKSCSRFCSSRDLCMAGIFVRISLICLSSFEATVLVGRRGSVPIFVRNPFSSDAHRFFSLQTDASLLLRERACVAPVAGEGRHSWTTMVTLNPTTNLHYCRRSCVFAHFRFVAFAFRSFVHMFAITIGCNKLEIIARLHTLHTSCPCTPKRMNGMERGPTFSQE